MLFLTATRVMKTGKAFSSSTFPQRLLVLLLAWPGIGGAAPFEQAHRSNELSLEFETDAFATRNAFGGAVVNSLAQDQLNTSFAEAVADGSISLLFRMPGLADLTGTTEPSFQVGVVSGSPVLPPGNPASYSGTSDLDWWYMANPSELDASGAPIHQLPAQIVAKMFSAGPGPLAFAPGTLGQMSWKMSGVAMKAAIGPSLAPLRSTNNFPPGHLPAENLDPALVSFASMSAGQLKGNISAASLARTPIPASILQGASGSYSPTNSMLDLLVGGLIVFGFVRVVQATQPDQDDPGAPPAGAGPPYVFSANPSRAVTTARDRNGVVVDLEAALADAAYSAYFRFTTDRVIVRQPPEVDVGTASVKMVQFDRNGVLSWTNEFCTATPVYEIVCSPAITGPWQHLAFVTNQHHFTLPSPPSQTVFYRVAWYDDDLVVLDYAYDEHGIGEPSVVGTLRLDLPSRAVSWLFEETSLNTSPHPLGSGAMINAIRMNAGGETIVTLRFIFDDVFYLKGRLRAASSGAACGYRYSGTAYWISIGGESPYGTFMAQE